MEVLEPSVLQRLEEGTHTTLAQELHLPAPNKFIPYALQTVEDPSRVRARDETSAGTGAGASASASVHQLNLPVLLDEAGSQEQGQGQGQQGGWLFYTPDRLFGHPRSALFLHLHPPSSSLCYSVQQNQLNRLTTKFYSRLHAVARYPSELAGLDHSVIWWKRCVA